VTAADAEAQYYQAVEEFFVSRRGDPLFLSNADWLLIRRWRLQGLPLRIVLRGIADALESHAHSWNRERKVGSLRYCEAEVEAARERWERALAIGAEPGVDIGTTLLGFAKLLGAATGLGRKAANVADRASGEVAELAARPGMAREVEEKLRRLEGEILVAIRTGTESEELHAVEAAVDATLARYRAKMPARVFGELRAQSIVRELLAAHGLPRLSLFGI